MYTLYICGARGTRTVCTDEFREYGGETSCFVFKEDKHALVIDAGSGLNRAEAILKDCTQIDLVLTHLHLDHIIGILNNAAFPITAKIRIYSTFLKWEMYDGLKTFPRRPFWPIQAVMYEYINIHRHAKYMFGGIELRIYDSNHPDGASVLKLKVNDKIIHFMTDYEHGVYADSEAYLHDDMKQPCDLLFYDGTYTPQEYPLYVGYGHSTYAEGIKLAELVRAKKLYIIHHDPSRTDMELNTLSKIAKEKFKEIEFVKNGQIIEI